MNKSLFSLVLIAFLTLPLSFADESPLSQDYGPGICGSILAGSNYWNEVDENPALSPAAEKLLRESLKGIPYIVDVHMHLLGVQTEKTGCFMHPDIFGYWNAFQWLKTQAVTAAAGIKDGTNADEEAFLRKLNLVTRFPYGVHYLGSSLAFSATYDPFSGEIMWDKTSLMVPNDYMLKVTAKAHPYFLPVASVHPFDVDAIAKLQELHAKGVRLIKWLPNSQHIPPGHPRVFQFFAELSRLKIVLLTHVGDEHAVNATGVENRYGNPELYRAALRKYPDLHIIFAHVGSEGSSIVNYKERENFDLVISLLKDFPKQAFADVSAFTSAFKRVRYLPQLLQEKSVHGQLVYGTDYPLPAVGSLVYWTNKYMWMRGLLTFEQTGLIHEIFRHNPLAAAFVSMRAISYEGHSFPLEMFYKNIHKVFHQGNVPAQLTAAVDLTR